jgi:hypothetical protein
MPRRAIGFVRRVCASPLKQPGAYRRKSDWQAAYPAQIEIQASFGSFREGVANPQIREKLTLASFGAISFRP